VSGPKAKLEKFYTGVAFDREVAVYIDEIAERMGWSRSLVLDLIVREHARNSGEHIAVPALKSLLAEKDATK
jgi:hypothetical protein